jgi:hypothetical protein
LISNPGKLTGDHFADFLQHLRDMEKQQGIEPDMDIDAFMRATAVSGTRSNSVTNYILRVLGLEVRGSNPSSLVPQG